MRRRHFLSIAALSMLPLQGRAQQTKTIGLLWTDSVKPSPYIATLLGALQKLGWTVGRNLKLEDRIALEGYGALNERAAFLAKQRCDVIAAYGASSTDAAARATKDIPIAMLIGIDPVRIGLAKSLARPGGNVTGVLNLSQGLVGKRLELLRELIPGLKEIGYLGAVVGVAGAQARAEEAAKEAAAKLKLDLNWVVVKDPGEVDAALAGFAKAGVRAVYVAQGTFMASHAARVVQAMHAHKLVAVYTTERFAEAGGLIAYGANANKAFVSLASYVDRLLRGAKPADMPIEQLSEVEMVINLKTAKATGFKIPQSILQRADRAIE